MSKKQQIKINLPLYVHISANKIFVFNLNNYRNAHYLNLSKAKRLFKTETEHLFYGVNKRFKKIKLVYTLYKNDGRKCDVNNVCTIIDKFACDVLVDLGLIPDDNYKYLPETVFKWGGIDVENPRIEMEIIEL